MQAFAAGELWPWLEPFTLEKLAHAQCRLDDEVPCNTGAGIEVEHQHVSCLDIVHGRRPRVYLDDVHFDQPEKSSEAIDPYPHTLAAFALLDAKLMHVIGDRR